MHLFRNLPIERKLTVISLLTSGSALLLACAVLVTYDYLSFRGTLVRDLSITAQMVGYNSAAALSFNESGSAETTLQSLVAQPHIVAACIYNAQGQVFASYRRTNEASSPWPSPVGNRERFNGESLDLFRKIEFSGETIGTVYLQSDLVEIHTRLARYAGISAAVLLIAILVAWALSARFHRIIAEPISDLAAVADRVATDKNYSLRATKHGDDELGRLIDAFNEMLARIQTHDDALQRVNDELESRVGERTRQLQTEVGERTRIAESLKTSEASLDPLLQNIPVCVYRKDTAGRFTFGNRRHAEYKGLLPAELLGKTDFDVSSRELAAQYTRDDLTVMETRQPVETEELHIKPGGEKTWIQVTKVPVIDIHGQVVGTQGIYWDVTTRKQAEEALKTAKEAAEAAVRVKSEFLANMSHEIRTPMNAVIGMTGLLLDTRLEPVQREFTETIRNSADALLTIINDILDFSKIEAGKLSFEILPFDLVETVEGTLDMFAERALRKHIELAASLPPDLPMFLRGDPGRLRQILTNLLGNALKFTKHGNVTIQLAKESETDTHAVVRFAVIDTGIGIPAEAQARLFQAFNQADNSTTRKYGGTGLGLAISKQLVTLMEGCIGVDSQPDKGSTFWFTARFEKQKEGGPKFDHRDLLDVRVLVVDDNATNRQILRHQLFAWKIQKGSAAGGVEALELLREAAAEGHPYHLALLDMQMPEMDGLMLARAIKADPAIAETRLIILTSLGQIFSAEELQAARIDAYLVKPVKQSRLFDCLLTVLDGTAADFTRHSQTTDKTEVPLDLSRIQKARILLAEDNTVNQKVALAQLHSLGCSADAVANGEEVLSALQQIPYDLILMDCQMPEMDGYETTRAIRRQEKDDAQVCPWKAPIPIIAMTANAMQGDREKCIAAGMNDYIAKPVRLPELKAALARWPGGEKPDAEVG